MRRPTRRDRLKQERKNRKTYRFRNKITGHVVSVDNISAVQRDRYDPLDELGSVITWTVLEHLMSEDDDYAEESYDDTPDYLGDMGSGFSSSSDYDSGSSSSDSYDSSSSDSSFD